MQKKDIIYLSDGTKLGKIIDAEIEVDTGKVLSFTIEKKDIKTIFNNRDINIKFNQIKKIGEDVILIDTIE